MFVQQCCLNNVHSFITVIGLFSLLQVVIQKSSRKSSPLWKKSAGRTTSHIDKYMHEHLFCCKLSVSKIRHTRRRLDSWSCRSKTTDQCFGLIILRKVRTLLLRWLPNSWWMCHSWWKMNETAFTNQLMRAWLRLSVGAKAIFIEADIYKNEHLYDLIVIERRMMAVLMLLA